MQSLIKRKYVAVKGKKHFVQIFSHVTNDCTNRPNKSKLDERSNKLINHETEDNSSSHDKYHDTMENDELDISDYNQDDDHLELMDFLSEEGDEDDFEEDINNFSLT